MRRSWRHGEWRDEERSCHHIGCTYIWSPCCALQAGGFSLDGYENKIEVTFFSVALDLVPEVPQHREVVNYVMGQIFRLEQTQEIRKSKALKILRIESP